MTLVCRNIEYSDGDHVLEGYLACTGRSRQPAIMIAHMWGGRVEFVCERARDFAALGYTAFALDMYGKSVLGRNPQESAALMQPFVDDRQLLLRRMQCALQTVQQLPEVDADNIVAVGYCFGGLCVLDLARAGARLRGAVSVHGLLDPPSHSGGAQPIGAKILVLHGSNDPLAPMDSVNALQNELDGVAADWRLVLYGNTMHAFTNPLAQNPAAGTVYQPVSAQRSWQAMLQFIAEVTGRGNGT